MEITVETNLAEFEGWIDKTVLKQMRFATSVTLYETAKQAQEAVRADLPHEFTIRNNWVSRGIRMSPGSSRAIRNSASGISDMQVEVGTVDEFMRMQAEGGVKKPNKADSVAVPVREPETEITSRKKWPRRVLKEPRTFLWRRPPDSKRFILQRAGDSRYPIKRLYTFEPEVRIPKRWPFLEKAEKIVSESYNENFNRAFERAMATAK